MKCVKLAITLVAASVMLSACVTTRDYKPNCGVTKTVGTVLGAGLGVYGGSHIGKGKGNTISMILGGMLGAAAGNQAGDSACEEKLPEPPSQYKRWTPPK